MRPAPAPMLMFASLISVITIEVTSWVLKSNKSGWYYEAFDWVSVTVFCDAAEMVVITEFVVFNEFHCLNTVREASFHGVTSSISNQLLILTTRFNGDTFPAKVPFQ
eukprot:c6643_g1_i2.p2 GENE.c6643_g1_i2~~c6643_g1_i2.p2  ORF type:complete len:107 (+),score=12.22 c6643_g1_i2:352-672(+)